MRALPAELFELQADHVAKSIIGVQLLVHGIGGRIIETEAYDRQDPASHSFGGPTARNASMFGSPAHVYIYRSYGIHWCLNIVCGPGSAVLIRALEPERGLDVMKTRRGNVGLRDLCRGPGRLCQALAITGDLDGHAIDVPPFSLSGESDKAAVLTGRRVGITRGTETVWRFGMAGSTGLSRPMRA